MGFGLTLLALKTSVTCTIVATMSTRRGSNASTAVPVRIELTALTGNVPKYQMSCAYSDVDSVTRMSTM